MSFRYDGFRFALFLLCALCFLSTALSVAFWSAWGFYPFYFVALTAALTAISAAAVFGCPEPWRYPKQDVLICLALLAGAALLRFPHLGTVALWSDEDLQNWFVLRRMNLVYMAAYGQQPPLHHFLALATLKLFGVSLFNLRFFTALSGTLAVPLFYCLNLRFGVHRLLALCGALLFLSNGWLVSYSQEAKPYMLAVFFAVVWLRASYDCFFGPPRRAVFGVQAVCGILLLHSVGVQPMLFFFLLSGLAAVYFALRGERARLLGWSAAAVVSFLAFLPDLVLIRVLSATKGYIRPFPGLGAYFGNLWRGLPGYLADMKLLLEGNWILYAAAAAGGALALHQILRKKEDVPQTAALFALAASLLFPLAIYAFFSLFVTLQLMYYYLILLWPLLFFAACAAMECLRRASGRWSAAILALAAGGSALVAVAEVRKPSVKTAEQNIPGLYEYLERHAEPRSLAFYFTVNETPPTPGISPEIGFIGNDYYYTPALKQKVALSSAWDRQQVYGMQMDAIYEEIEDPTEPRRFYFFAFNRENEFNFAAAKFSPVLQAQGKQFPDPNYGDWAAASLLQIDNPFGSRATLTRFFADLAAQTPHASLNLKAYVALAHLAVLGGRCKEAEGYFAKIHALCTADYPDCRSEWRVHKNYERICAGGVKLPGALW